MKYALKRNKLLVIHVKCDILILAVQGLAHFEAKGRTNGK